ncbi:hypothetical protein GCM10010310_79170 [Streptomyces violaceolatus]|uniref:Uncharacterized protein n=1 Tax=Streptomyces violaceolatus TaxID=67378 RepID=A0ABN3TIW9_9ACTN
MFPIYIPGVGWVFQPVLPLATGCVYTPSQPKRFGFRRLSVGVLSAVVLIWLWTDHPVEVVAAVIAAAAVETLVSLSERLSRLPHGRQFFGGGGIEWRAAW